MTTRSAIRVIGFAALLLSACVLEFEDFSARGCDEERGCREGQVCASGVCTVPSGPWTQGVHGFEAREQCRDCELSISLLEGNRVRARVLGIPEDRAFASTPITLAMGAEGRIRGRVLFPEALRLGGVATLLLLRTASGDPFLELALQPEASLLLGSATGTLSADAVMNGIGPPGFDTVRFFSAGAGSVVDVAWRRGQTIELRLDDVLVFQRTLRDDGTLSASPVELQLGVIGHAAPPEAVLEVELFDWRIGDRFDVVP